MADNLTHGLAAALLAQTGFRQRYGPAATVALGGGQNYRIWIFSSRSAAPSSASCTTGG